MLLETEIVANLPAWANFIASIGFPIFCCLAMFYMWNKEREEHKAETEKFVEAINNNTVVMTQIKEMIKNG